jgi:hypothetical protein
MQIKITVLWRKRHRPPARNFIARAALIVGLLLNTVVVVFGAPTHNPYFVLAAPQAKSHGVVHPKDISVLEIAENKWPFLCRWRQLVRHHFDFVPLGDDCQNRDFSLIARRAWPFGPIAELQRYFMQSGRGTAEILDTVVSEHSLVLVIAEKGASVAWEWVDNLQNGLFKFDKSSLGYVGSALGQLGLSVGNESQNNSENRNENGSDGRNRGRNLIDVGRDERSHILAMAFGAIGASLFLGLVVLAVWWMTRFPRV